MNIVKYSFLTLLIVGMALDKSVAQQSPVVSSYFQNEYLFNSAQVGVNQTKAVDAFLRTPIGQFKDDMKENNLHVMYGFGRNGIGAGFKSNKTGAFKLTEFNASYAFHIPLADEGQSLSFGTAVKFLREQIDINKIVGDENDPTVAYYNNDPNRVDFNLGAAYTSNSVSVNVAMNNILRERRDFLLNPTPFMYSSIKYKMLFDDLSVVPVVAYRRLLNDQDIFDFGTSIGFTDLFTTYVFYHTSKNFSAGVSTKLNKVQLNIGYGTTTNRVQGLGVQGLDLGLRYAW